MQDMIARLVGRCESVQIWLHMCLLDTPESEAALPRSPNVLIHDEAQVSYNIIQYCAFHMMI